MSREIRVALDPDRLMALGVTAADVNRQLRATTVDLAGGKGDVGDAGAVDPHARRRAQGRGPAGRPRSCCRAGANVRLSEIADVTDAYEEPKSFARLDGDTPIVAFSIFRAKGASDTEVADRVAAKIEELGARRIRTSPTSSSTTA